MTFDERLEEILRAVADGSYTPHWGDDRLVLTVPEAITAIKQAMRETMPEPTQILVQVSDNEYLNGGYIKTDEIEKGFGLDG